MLRSLLQYFRNLTKLEKIAAVVMIMIIILCTIQLVWVFYEEKSTIYPAYGGEYKEGLVGKAQHINPVLSFAKNNADEDISRLVFSGLMKYNPATRQLEDDIATHTLSVDKLVYTYTLRDGTKWHDGTPVTTDDIMFTFRDVIQNENFSHVILKDAFRDVVIEKIDDKTVTFTIQKPYKFFIANLTIGLLPKHILGIVPVENLALSEFNLAPIGTGPYKFNSFVPSEGIAEVRLSVFEDYYGHKPYISYLTYMVYPSWDDLWEHLNDVNGFRVYDNRQAIELMGKYKLYDYQLFQYVALFLNNKSPILSNEKLRLGLQLATNKQDIVDQLGGNKIIDTPLLEIDRENWVYQFDPKRAAGAFVDTEWRIPGKKYTGTGSDATDTVVTEADVNTEGTEPVTNITGPNEGKDWETDEESFYITGNNPAGLKQLYVNDYQLQLFKPEKGSFSFFASAKIGTLKKGVNVYRVYGIDENDEKKELDAIKIVYKPKETAIDTDESDDGYTRQNSKGQKLRLNLITKTTPPVYVQVAEIVKQQWKKVGVDLVVKVLEGKEFDEAVMKRDYDILLYGQNLGYNLDAYPYWHSSQTGDNGVNLSEYASFAADALFEEIRATHDEEKRKEGLNELQDVLSEETPAIFLYSPTYSYAVDNSMRSIAVNNLALHSDRLNAIHEWFIKQRYSFRDDASWFDFFGWVIGKM